MSYEYGKKVAIDCALCMNKNNFIPSSIINVGVSSAPEALVWKRFYSDVPVLGIDPKVPRGWVKFPYIRAAVVGDSRRRVRFCFSCGNLVCKKPEIHKRKKVWGVIKAIRLDDLSLDLIPPPHFIWMDIDGGELSALQSGKETLDRTEWLCVETYPWTDRTIPDIDEFLYPCGFVISKRFVYDTLYRKKYD